MAPPKAIVWDLDGVLLDSEPIYLGVERKLAEEHGAIGDASGLIGKVLGRSGLVSAKIIVDELKLSITPEEFLAQRDARLANAFQSAELCRGAMDLVKHFQSLGLPCAIATSSCAHLLAVKRKAQPELFKLMNAVVCADDVAEAKPAPLLFLEAAQRLGIEPEKCVVFEDAPAGVLAAKRAGMRSVALRNPHVPRAEYENAGGDTVHVVDSGCLTAFDVSHIDVESKVKGNATKVVP